MITGQEIEDIVYQKVKDAQLPISGSVYKRGTRPIDSKEVDCVVAFLTGTADQIQEGEVVVNIYVPDVNMKDGLFYKDTKRCKQYEQMLKTLQDTLNVDSDIRYTMSGMIATLENFETNEHYVSVKFRFKTI